MKTSGLWAPFRYKGWHSNYFRNKYIFNILFYVQTRFSHSLPIQAAITEYWRMGGLKNKQLFLTVLKARKFKTRAPMEYISGRRPPPGLHVANSSLYLYMGESRERAHTCMQALQFLLIKASIPSVRTPPSRLNHLPVAPPLYRRLWFQHTNFPLVGGEYSIQYSIFYSIFNTTAMYYNMVIRYPKLISHSFSDSRKKNLFPGYMPIGKPVPMSEEWERLNGQAWVMGRYPELEGGDSSIWILGTVSCCSPNNSEMGSVPRRWKSSAGQIGNKHTNRILM